MFKNLKETLLTISEVIIFSTFLSFLIKVLSVFPTINLIMYLSLFFAFTLLIYCKNTCGAQPGTGKFSSKGGNTHEDKKEEV